MTVNSSVDLADKEVSLIVLEPRQVQYIDCVTWQWAELSSLIAETVSKPPVSEAPIER